MNVLVLHGSPRKNKNSDTLADFFLKGLQSNGKRRIRHFYLNDLKIKPCQGCLHCSMAPEHECSISDDMGLIYTAYKEADLIVFTTPMYWGYMTAQMKTAFDRMEALAWQGFAGKIFVVLITYNFHCQSTLEFFQRISPFFKIRLHYISCRTYDHIHHHEIPVADCQAELQQAYNLGKTIGATE
ncbi:MAG: flavodoxin family protein [Candidatus Cloacimonetes bacterium]|nr:flavodoxin family protein [Candidatus Cloacimonadota bacterium]